MKETEQHPWAWYAPKDATYLIIGTFPSAKRNWSYDFFYPNVNNLFWKIMADISNHKLVYFKDEDAVRERKGLLDNLHIAISDMGHTIERNDGSSLDEKLNLITAMDIFQILDENPGIHKIILTSSTGKASALGWFKHYLKGKEILLKIKAGRKPLYADLQYRDRNIKIAVLHSPSARAANRISFEALVQLYRNELIET